MSARKAFASASPDALAFVQGDKYPSLGLFTVVPMADKDCLDHLASCLEADGQIGPRERFFAAQYLRRLAGSPVALKALRPGKRGAPAGRAWDKTLHYVVRARLSSPRLASIDVARIWGGRPESVQDSPQIEKARAEIESVVSMRLAGPSRYELPDGSLSAPKHWRNEREVLLALDADLTARASARGSRRTA